MNQYLLSVHEVEGMEAPRPETVRRAIEAGARFNQLLKDQGAWVFAGGLMPPTAAVVIRVEEGEVIATDGPFAETKEHLGGVWVINAPDLEAAKKWAALATEACWGPVEVRPFQGATDA
jgi:hypothetical protein